MLEQITQISSVFIIPALWYIVVLERRITTMQVQIETMINILKDKKNGS